MDGLWEIAVIFVGFSEFKGNEGLGNFSSSILWQISIQTWQQPLKKGE